MATTDDWPVWNRLQPAYPSGRGHVFEEFGYVEVRGDGGAHYTVSFDVLHDGTAENSMSVTPVAVGDDTEYVLRFGAVAYIARTGYYAPTPPSNVDEPMFRTVMLTGLQVTYQVAVTQSGSVGQPTGVQPKRASFLMSGYPNPTDLQNVTMTAASGPSSNAWAQPILQSALFTATADATLLQGVDLFRRSMQVVKPGQNSWAAAQPSTPAGMTAPYGHINVSIMDCITALRARTMDSKNVRLAFLSDQVSMPASALWDESTYTMNSVALGSRIIMNPATRHWTTQQSNSLKVRGVRYSDMALYAAFAKDDMCGRGWAALLYLHDGNSDTIDFRWVPLAWRVGPDATSTARWKAAPKQAYMPVSVDAGATRACQNVTRHGNFYSAPNTPGAPKIMYQGNGGSQTHPMYLVQADKSIDVEAFFEKNGILYRPDYGGSYSHVAYAGPN